MSEMEPGTDVVELCALLQCLGYSVKSLDVSDGNVSQDAGTKTVVINCQSSGLHAILESDDPTCSCPPPEQQNSGFWQISGVAGGKQHDKESGSAILCSLPKTSREHVAKELQEIVRCIKNANDCNVDKRPTNMSASMIDLMKDRSSLIELEKEGNKSASMLELGTPEKRHMLLKAETPTRYRSLDTLTSAKNEVEPPISMLQKQIDDVKKEMMQTTGMMGSRQSTYTVCSTPGSVKQRNKTSSPIQTPQNNLLENLIELEKSAENLRNKLAVVIKEYLDDGRNDSSSMLDVSKISLLKGEKSQFSSSPNLSTMGTLREELPKSRLKRFESVSTSNLKPATDKGTSKLKNISPGMFNKLKKGSPSGTGEKISDGKSKLRGLFRPKIVTPIRVSKGTQEANPNLSAMKKKYSHVKSTIPRPTPKKE